MHEEIQVIVLSSQEGSGNSQTKQDLSEIMKDSPFALRPEHDIYFIARGSHKNAIRKNGLTLKKAGSDRLINVSPEICSDTVDDLPVCDIVVLSVKGYDLGDASKEISKIVDEKTIIIPLLNLQLTHQPDIFGRT